MNDLIHLPKPNYNKIHTIVRLIACLVIAIVVGLEWWAL